ncbi:MAG: RNA polymerase sigma factor [Ktedonobacteraceae bacterium]
MILRQSTLGRSAYNVQEKVGQHTPTFKEILQWARCGDSEGLSTLYRQFLPTIFGYIAARVPDRDIAEDLTSEVFIKMIEGIGHLRSDEEAGFASWLLQIARMTVAGYYRKRARQPIIRPLDPLVQEEQEESMSLLTANKTCDDPLEWLIARDEWQTVVEAMNRLTEEQRQVLISRLILEYDVATVAKMLGKTATAIKSLQFRAIQSLQRFLMHQVTAHQRLHQREEIQ